jgi:hypothetical protein
MGSLASAEAAAGAVNGKPGDPLLVVPYFKVDPNGTATAAAEPSHHQQRWQQAAPEARPPAATSPLPAAPAAPLFPSFAGRAVLPAVPSKPLFPGERAWWCLM